MIILVSMLLLMMLIGYFNQTGPGRSHIFLPCLVRVPLCIFFCLFETNVDIVTSEVLEIVMQYGF